MRSSSGNYYIGLDHIRAVAAFLVFSWHFIHAGNGYPVPFTYVPSLFPFSLVNEGHTGVALFMTLSGYLFAKLLDAKKINPIVFIWNRFLRLIPLLMFVILIIGYLNYRAGNDLIVYTRKILMGTFLPSLPNGGWSITIEFHFYLLLPLLLWLSRKFRFSLLVAVFGMLAVRYFLYQLTGQIQTLAFWTIVGRLDQFLWGIIAYRMNRYIAGRHVMVLCCLCAFSLFYWYFDLQGGFYHSPSYPSHRMIWVFMPTIEGLAYAIVICWYDNSFRHSTNSISYFFAQIGSYSYSIYLLHFFIVFAMARTIHEHIVRLSNFYVALFFSAVCFLLMIPIGAASFRLIESPFLKLRKRYVV